MSSGNKNDLLIRIPEVCFGPNYSFYDVFDKYGIKTVDQIMDNNVMQNVMLNCENEKMIRSLMGFISLVNFKYNGVLIPENNLLNTVVDKKSMTIDEFTMVFLRLGFNEKQINVLRRKVPFNGRRIIDVFNECLSNDFFDIPSNRIVGRSVREFLSIKSIMDMHAKSYNMQMNYAMNKSNELNELVFLRDQLSRLENVRDGLDLKINMLTKEIKTLKSMKKQTEHELTDVEHLIDEENSKSGGKR